MKAFMNNIVKSEILILCCEK